MNFSIPPELEAIVKKAAEDSYFREQLLRERSRAAEKLSLPLGTSGKQMLDSFSETELEEIIRRASSGERKSHWNGLGITAGVLFLLVILVASGIVPVGLNLSSLKTEAVREKEEEPLSKLTFVKTENRTFKEALALIEAEQNLKIEVEIREKDSFDLERKLPGPVAGFPLKEALEAMCLSIRKGETAYKIFSPSPKLVRILLGL